MYSKLFLCVWLHEKRKMVCLVMFVACLLIVSCSMCRIVRYSRYSSGLIGWTIDDREELINHFFNAMFTEIMCVCVSVDDSLYLLVAFCSRWATCLYNPRYKSVSTTNVRYRPSRSVVWEVHQILTGFNGRDFQSLTFEPFQWMTVSIYFRWWTIEQRQNDW